MRAIKINTVIDPSVIRFDELKEFEGKKAEIIILVEDHPAPKNVQGKYSAAGILKEYADIQKVAEESTAYEKHVKAKYGNHRR